MVRRPLGAAVGFLASWPRCCRRSWSRRPFAGAALVAGDCPLGRRVFDVVTAAATMILSGGWYLVPVELWPASARPYIGGSQNDSIVELAWAATVWETDR